MRFLVCVVLVAVVLGEGVDLFELTSEDSFKCLKSKGYTYAVVRCFEFESVGQPDPNWSESDGAMNFPCP